MTFEGKEVTWETFPELLGQVPDRDRTVLELSFDAGVRPEGLTQVQGEEWLRKKGVFKQTNVLREQFGFEYLSFVGQHPLGSKGDATETYFDGPLSFYNEIPIPLESAEDPPLIKCQWIKFDRTGDNVTANLKIKLVSHPKAKWEFRLTLLDVTNQYIDYTTHLYFAML